MCAAPNGNQFWKLRSKHGRDKLFATPELLWEAACEYFEWCDKNPLIEVRGFAYKGKVEKEDFPKLRAYTLNGLCLYLGCSDTYFRTFKQEQSQKQDSQGFLSVIDSIEKTIYEQKFAGAAAELLNPNIIARDLGLADKKDVSADVTINIAPIDWIE